MVEVVNRSQQVRAMTLRPKPIYSRVIALDVIVPGDGNWRYLSTPPLGQNIWLLYICATVDPLTRNVARETLFQVWAGNNRPNSLADVQSWDIVMPLYNENNTIIEWGIVDGEVMKEWSMDKFYEGQARRFAISYIRGPGWGDNDLNVCFQISEG